MSQLQAVLNIPCEKVTGVLDSPQSAANFLKALSHEGRLMILCHLVSGPKSVTELQNLLSCRQSSLSQQLSRLRLEELVISRKCGQIIYYSLNDRRATQTIKLLHDLFCVSDPDKENGKFKNFTMAYV
jgi:ArsR family transcriptional regulator